LKEYFLLMRTAVAELSDLGQLPSSDAAIANPEGGPLLERIEQLVTSIQRPVTDEEARALVKILPSDDDECFGLAWTVLHLIETAPGWPLADCLPDTSNRWVRRLKERAVRGGVLPSE
jgi:hypothetical protein